MAARNEAIPVTMEGDIRRRRRRSRSLPPALRRNRRAAHGYFRRESALAKDAARDNEETGQAKAAARMQAPAPPANVASAPPAAERKEAAARDKTAALAPEPQAADRLDLSRNAAGTSPQSQQSGGLLYDRAGGDGANFTDADFGVSLPVHITITAADGGTTPELLADHKIDLPASERGREYSIAVDPQGRVTDVRRVQVQTYGQRRRERRAARMRSSRRRRRRCEPRAGDLGPPLPPCHSAAARSREGR